MINNNMFIMLKEIFNNPSYVGSARNINMVDVMGGTTSVGIVGPDQNQCNTWALKNRTPDEIFIPEVFDRAYGSITNNTTTKPLSLNPDDVTYSDFTSSYSLNNGLLEIETTFTVTCATESGVELKSACLYSDGQKYFTYDSSYGDWNPNGNNSLIVYMCYNFAETIALANGESKTITLKESISLA